MDNDRISVIQQDFSASWSDHKYRRQFVAAFEKTNRFSSWQHCEFPEQGFHIYAHPDLELSSTLPGERKNRFVLLGFALNYEHPEWTNKDILNGLMDSDIDSAEALANAVIGLGGRFVIIASLSNQLYVFHDPCGLRTVFYAQANEKLYLASEPVLFSEFFPLIPSGKYSEFLKSSYRLKNILYFLPTGLSCYDNTYQLIPNHYLDVSHVTQKRYWPNQSIANRTIEEATQTSADILVRLLLASSYRYKLGFFITAGWDSRLLLAASRSIASPISVYTMLLENMNEQSPDASIPQSISRSNERIHFEFLNCQADVDPDFERLFNENIDFAHPHSAKVTYGLFLHYPRETLAVKANCSEITRCTYYFYGFHDDINTPSELAAMEPGWERMPFIVEYLDQWLKDAKQVCTDNNIQLLDLFYWEIRMGSWLSHIWREKDIAQESFTPFNHRPLLATMLGVPNKYRREPDYLLYQRMISYLWPEQLNWPINPKEYSLSQKMNNHLRRLMLKLELYGHVRKLYKSTSRFVRKLIIDKVALLMMSMLWEVVECCP